MNVLYTLFDAAVMLGRVFVLCVMLGFVFFLVGLIVFQLFLVAGIGVGGFVGWQILQDPPDLVREIMGM